MASVLKFSNDDVSSMPSEVQGLIGHLGRITPEIGTAKFTEIWSKHANKDNQMTHEATTDFFKELAVECNLIWDAKLQDDLLAYLKDDPYSRGHFLSIFGKIEEDISGGDAAAGFNLTYSLRAEIAQAQMEHK